MSFSKFLLSSFVIDVFDSDFLDNYLDIPSELISSQIMPALRYLERDSREYATDVNVSRSI